MTGNGKKILKTLNQGRINVNNILHAKEFVRKHLLEILLGSMFIGGVAGYGIHSEGKEKENKTQQELKEAMNEQKIFSKDQFITYLTNNNLYEIDRTKTLGRYVRVVRYEKDIKFYAEKYGIPYEYFFALIMVESQGNPASINEKDGGAGFVHFQPDVFKRVVETYLKDEKDVFTDKEAYNKYDFETLKEQGWKKGEIYKKHGELLEQLLTGRGMISLEKIDNRFNYKDILEATAVYLQQIKKKVDKGYAKATSDTSWDKHKNNVEFDLKWMLALNGFNKGPGNFAKNYEGGSALAANHINNVKSNLRDMRFYEKQLEELIKQGMTGDEIIAGLATMYESAGKNSEGLDIFKYSGPKTTRMQLIINFNFWDDMYNGNLYKNIGYANIVDKEGKEIKNEITNWNNVYIKVRDLFDLQKEKDSKGNIMFKCEPGKKQTVKDIVEGFNKRNAQNGYKYVNATDTSITDVNGNILKKIGDNKAVIVKTKPVKK